MTLLAVSADGGGSCVSIETFHHAEAFNNFSFAHQGAAVVFDDACSAEESAGFKTVEALCASGGRQYVRGTGAEITDGFRSPRTHENRSGGFDFAAPSTETERFYIAARAKK